MEGVGTLTPSIFLQKEVMTVRKKASMIAALIAACALVGLLKGAEPAAEARTGFVFDPEKAGASANGGVSLLPKKQGGDAAPAKDCLRQWDDEAIFLDVAGVDRIKWKLLREQIEDQVNNFPRNPGMDAEAVNNARTVVFQVKLARLLRKYLQYSLIAVEARKLGFTVDPVEMEKNRELSRKGFAGKGAAGQRQLRLMKEPDSFYEHNLTNAMLWRAYAKKVVEPTVKISEEEVAELIKARHQENLDALATNHAKRVQMDMILREVKKGMTFGKAAETWSECQTSDTGGVFTDAEEKPQEIRQGDVRQEMEQAYATLKEGQVSGVVETPYSWHIVKLIKRKLDEDGKCESVNLAHIMLEKVLLKPELTPDQARQQLLDKQTTLLMGKKFLELLNTTKIDCLVPVREDPNAPKRKRTTKRVYKENDKK